MAGVALSDVVAEENMPQLVGYGIAAGGGAVLVIDDDEPVVPDHLSAATFAGREQVYRAVGDHLDPSLFRDRFERYRQSGYLIVDQALPCGIPCALVGSIQQIYHPSLGMPG